MNNKIVFVLMGFIFSPLTASERIQRQVIIAQIEMNNKDTQNYEVKDVRKLDGRDFLNKDIINGFNIYYCYPLKIDRENRDSVRETTINTVTSDRLVIEGSGTHNWIVQFSGDSYVNLKKDLEKVNKVPKADEVDDRLFQISLINEEVTQGVSLDLTEAQFYLIMSQKPKSCIPKVLTAVTIGGVAVFLLIYFNLHSKAWALLGRG